MAQESSVALVRRRYPDFGRRLPPIDPFLRSDAPLLSYTQWEAWLGHQGSRRCALVCP
jgi:hypothetical protein